MFTEEVNGIMVRLGGRRDTRWIKKWIEVRRGNETIHTQNYHPPNQQQKNQTEKKMDGGILTNLEGM